MTKQLPIDHHFAPIFYLNAWAAADGRVIRYSRPRDVVAAKSNAPSRTGSEANLYSLQGVSPERQAVLETDFFQPVDDKAAATHATLLNGGHTKLTDRQRVDWARFMMSMQHRSPFSLGEPPAWARQRARAGSRGKRPAGLPVVARRDDPCLIDRSLTSWGQLARLADCARKPTCPARDRNAQMAAFH